MVPAMVNELEKRDPSDISNDHISDQLVLEPEELVLTDVTARTGLAFF